MNELYWMVTIADRNKIKRYLSVYEECGISVTFNAVGYGTAAGEMLEYARYVENYYGTPAQAVKRQLEKGLGVILEIEVQGAMQVMSKVEDAVSIFILPPDRQTLIDRLHGRGTEPEDVINKRVAMAMSELDEADRYRYRVVNDDLDDAIADVIDILAKEQVCIDFN